MNKVIVTGGAGFVGSHVAQELTKRDCEVIIIDNLINGRLSNIEPLLSTKNTVFVRGSIIDLPLLRKLFSGVDIQCSPQHQELESLPRCQYYRHPECAAGRPG
jgi:dTDP-L-rhamnose 4-epimerase